MCSDRSQGGRVAGSRIVAAYVRANMRRKDMPAKRTWMPGTPARSQSVSARKWSYLGVHTPQHLSRSAPGDDKPHLINSLTEPDVTR
jgi:hypothetical protein